MAEQSQMEWLPALEPARSQWLAQATDDPVPLPPEAIPPQIEAPSFIWLIVMPAIPIVGGALIYLSRRWLGPDAGEVESRTMGPPPPPETLPVDAATPSETVTEAEAYQE